MCLTIYCESLFENMNLWVTTELILKALKMEMLSHCSELQKNQSIAEKQFFPSCTVHTTAYSAS